MIVGRVSTDTVFPIASISKTVCGTAIMRLHDQGKLDVEARVQDYLPDFALGDASAARELRLWHLLTHTPGFEGQLDTPNRGPSTSEHFVETLCARPEISSDTAGAARLSHVLLVWTLDTVVMNDGGPLVFEVAAHELVMLGY